MTWGCGDDEARGSAASPGGGLPAPIPEIPLIACFGLTGSTREQDCDPTAAAAIGKPPACLL
jgi:hypothetical protein